MADATSGPETGVAPGPAQVDLPDDVLARAARAADQVGRAMTVMRASDTMIERIAAAAPVLVEHGRRQERAELAESGSILPVRWDAAIPPELGGGRGPVLTDTAHEHAMAKAVAQAEARGAAQERERIRAGIKSKRLQDVSGGWASHFTDGLDAALAVVDPAAPVSDGQGEKECPIRGCENGHVWAGQEGDQTYVGLCDECGPDRVTVSREDLQVYMLTERDWDGEVEDATERAAVEAAADRLRAALDREGDQ